MNHDKSIATLEQLGYNDFFQMSRSERGFATNPIARVVAEYKGAYKVRDAAGEYVAKITGKQMFQAVRREDYPAVGDWVALSEIDRDRAVICGTLARKTLLKRKYSDKQDSQIIAANIDIAFVIESVDRDFNLNRFERYLVLANEGKIQPVIVLNKVDLISETDLQTRIDQLRERFKNVEIITTSTTTEDGIRSLNESIQKGMTYCFLGSSGVGKSTLINRLLQKEEIKTKEISVSTGRGKHTTTAREMYFLQNGGIVIDNPGTREVGITDASLGIENVFDEIAALAEQCKYSNCTHEHERGCAVLKAVQENRLDKKRYENYLKLTKEAEHYEMSALEKRDKDRKFGQFLKKAKTQFRERD
jgi:ribosome biogenesis GTPase